MPQIQSENIVIESTGVRLGGTIVKPATSGPHPALILHHGSGLNDRNGGRNLIRCHAEMFARNGLVALSWDKRGVGESTGDWRSASFEDMADDALAALDLLAARDDVQQDAVGIWGISQAAWALGVVVSRRPSIPFAIVVSGAGFGMTVAEQVMYSVLNRMKLEGYSASERATIEAAWNLAFDAVRRPAASHEALDLAVDKIRTDNRLRLATPPKSDEIPDSDWMNALPLDFDARPLWQKFQGSLLALFGEDDPLLPVPEVVSELERVIAKGLFRDAEIHRYPNADHSILVEHVPSDGTIREEHFAPGYVQDTLKWLGARTVPASIPTG